MLSYASNGVLFVKRANQTYCLDFFGSTKKLVIIIKNLVNILQSSDAILVLQQNITESLYRVAFKVSVSVIYR